MSDVSVDLDEFGAAMEDILKDVEHGVNMVTPEAVKKGLKAGTKEWKANAPVDRGKYKKSIKNHMTKGGHTPTGEIGSPTMPGLPHLLEKGHARVGGGRVPAYVHIAPAAEAAFEETENALIEGIGRIL